MNLNCASMMSDMRDHRRAVVVAEKEGNGMQAQRSSREACPDAALMKLVAAGNRVAFSAIFSRFGPKVRSYALRLGAGAEGADDLVQDVMVSIWRRAATYDPAKAAVSTWIFTIARNRYIDLIRKSRHFDVEAEIEVPDEETPDQLAQSAQDRRHVAAALAQLPPDQREMVELAFLGEMSHSEIAAQKGLALGTVKSRIRLGMEKMRNVLEFRK